jgi:hypothetical protein
MFVESCTLKPGLKMRWGQWATLPPAPAYINQNTSNLHCFSITYICFNNSTNSYINNNN